jgi:hypothetical protein
MHLKVNRKLCEEIMIRGAFEKFMGSPYYSVYVSEKWVERFKKCIACQGRYFEKEMVTAPPQGSDSE